MRMNHDRERLFNDYVDGILNEEERRNVETFVASEPSAAEDLAAIQRVVADARELPQTIEPSRDLWTGIAAQLETMPRRQTVRRRPWRLALVAAMLTGAFIGGMIVAQRSPDESAGAPRRSQTGGTGDVMFAEFQDARAQYADARQTLLASLESSKASLSPETRAVIEENLAVINQAVTDIEAALARAPGNRHLMELLVAAYDDEVGLLREAAALPKEI